MRNGDKAAFPEQSFGELKGGLTKREYFAAMAMQGLLVRKSTFTGTSITNLAISAADLLLEALEEIKQ